VRGLSRRRLLNHPSIQADLTDADATAATLRGAADTTHVFYAALAPDPDIATEAARNAAMLGNMLDGLEAAGAPLQRVIIYQGFKIYGSHLGAKVPTPARESDPPHMPPNLYMAQEAALRERAARSRWDYVALRPDVVVGDIWGKPMNIALVVGAFAEISRALGVPQRFPGRQSLRAARPVHGLAPARSRQPMGRDEQSGGRGGVQRHQRRCFPLGADVE
jgi:nucleoside-diphosphate-sugar epimerase